MDTAPTSVEAQDIHDLRRGLEPEHDPIGCWCCCLDCDFDYDAWNCGGAPSRTWEQAADDLAQIDWLRSSRRFHTGSDPVARSAAVTSTAPFTPWSRPAVSQGWHQ